jgi:zinc protease
LTYLTPRQADPDSDALRVADAILSAGESSRLYHSLVYQQQLAAQTDANSDVREDVSLFVITAILSEGKKPEEAERSLLAEIKKMQDAPVSAAELEKAKNQIVTDQLRQRETSNGKALALGEAAVLYGDPNRANSDLSRLQAVTAADIQRVMKKYFTDNNRMVMYYLPEAKTGNNRRPDHTDSKRTGGGQVR